MAEARGLSERLCWIGLIRASRALRGGDWDAGVAAARAGLELAVRFRYDRAAVRTWFALTPMADARGDRATLEWAAAWFAEHEASFPHSPYGTVQHAGVDLRLADAGLGSPPALDDETLMAGLALDDDSPEWLAAVERIIEATVVAGRVELARTMVERLPPPGLGRRPASPARLAGARRLVAGRGGGFRQRRGGPPGPRRPGACPRGRGPVVGLARDPAPGTARRRDPGRARGGGSDRGRARHRRLRWCRSGRRAGGVVDWLPRRHSSAVEQLFRKQQVLGSNPSVGSSDLWVGSALGSRRSLNSPDRGAAQPSALAVVLDPRTPGARPILRGERSARCGAGGRRETSRGAAREACATVAEAAGPRTSPAGSSARS